MGLYNSGSLLSRVSVFSIRDFDLVGLRRVRFRRFNKVLRRFGGVRIFFEILFWFLIFKVEFVVSFDNLLEI